MNQRVPGESAFAAALREARQELIRQERLRQASARRSAVRRDAAWAAAVRRRLAAEDRLRLEEESRQRQRAAGRKAAAAAESHRRDRNVERVYQEKIERGGWAEDENCLLCFRAAFDRGAPGDHVCPLVRPTVGFHVAPRSSRASIEEHGLDWRLGRSAGITAASSGSGKVPRGNYVWDRIGNSSLIRAMHARSDVWSVDLHGVVLLPDPDYVGTFEGSWFCVNPIPAERCTRIVRRAGDEWSMPDGTASPGVRRNQPCPCGSGRKHKLCCG